MVFAEGASIGLRIEERSGSSLRPIFISVTREKPSVITVMFDVTTASPKRPNFFTYCLWTTLVNCSSEIPKVLRNGETRKKAPRKEFPCIRSCNSV